MKEELKGFGRTNKFEDKLEELVREMNRNREIDREAMMMHRQSQQPNIIYPPQYYPPQPQPSRFDDDYGRRKRDSAYDTGYNRKPKNRLRRLLRKCFFAVFFPILLKSEAKKLAEKRRANMRKFYL